MAFLVILGSLIAERFLLGYQYLRRTVWFDRWLELHQSLPISAGLREGRIGLLGILSVPLLLLLFAQWLIYDALFWFPWSSVGTHTSVQSVGIGRHSHGGPWERVQPEVAAVWLASEFSRSLSV